MEEEPRAYSLLRGDVDMDPAFYDFDLLESIIIHHEPSSLYERLV